jgi:NDP-4-keto-2,6-dideoxyhexose 3-C-methyltransferase
MQKCRICNSELNPFMDLGNIYPSNFIKKEDNSFGYKRHNLNMKVCSQCGLVQIDEHPELDSMYRQYWYKSSLNKSMVIALQDVISSIESRLPLDKGSTVIDIGCNDGTLLSLYKNKKIFKIGIDPALNLKEEAEKQCNVFINDFFDSMKLCEYYGKVDVVTAIACFYDLPNPHQFVCGVKDLLEPEVGMFVIQYTDLLQTLKINAVDNFVHEHVELYSFKNIVDLMEQHGLRVYNVTTNDVNGGSVRAYICHKDTNFYKTSESVKNMLKEEQEFMSKFENPFDAFKNRVDSIRDITRQFIINEVNHGKTIAVLGASTKGNTTLQYFNLNNSQIKFAAEVNKDKFGLKTIGSEIPIISEEEAFKLNPDYFLVLPWHFINGFKKIHADYLDNGGKFILPFPEFKIITNSW